MSFSTLNGFDGAPDRFEPHDEGKNSAPLLSIFCVCDDYRMNDPARKAVLLAAHREGRTTRYICLGYIEPGKFEGETEDERHAGLDAISPVAWIL